MVALVLVKVRLLYLSTLHQWERFATLNGFHYSLNLYLYPIIFDRIYLSFCVFVFVKVRLLYLSTLHQWERFATLNGCHRRWFLLAHLDFIRQSAELGIWRHLSVVLKNVCWFKNYYLYPKQASIESKDDFAISHINLFSVKQTKLEPG